MQKARIHLVNTGPAINPDAIYGEPDWPGRDFGLQEATICPVKAGRLRRRRNYWLMRKARYMLKDVQTPQGGGFRVCDCRRHVAKGLGGDQHPAVEVWRDRSSQVASFRKLSVCGSVWTCPVCSSKIASVRRGEVQGAAVQAINSGLSFCMVTLTVKHGVGDELKPMLEKMARALRLARNNRGPVTFRKGRGFRGLIRALEVTYGNANGWHPHFHELHFFDGELTSERCAEYRDVIAAAWVRACSTVGLPVPDFKISVDVKHVPRDDAAASKAIAAYVGKAFSCELVYGMKKTARGGRYSPFELLEHGRADLFRVYAAAFFGRRQLLWSPGLKEFLAVPELSDEDAAGDAVEIEGERADELLLSIPAADWPRLMRFPGDARAHLLDLLEGDELTDFDRHRGVTAYHQAEEFLRFLGVRALWGTQRKEWSKWWQPRHVPGSGLLVA